MLPTHDDRDLPVPDPDGNPIHPRELAAAEGRMLREVEREEPPAFQEPNGDPAAARQAIERQNSREMSDVDAATYRLAPEDMLDWLSAPVPVQDDAVLERWENHLDWLERDDVHLKRSREDAIAQELDRER